jgi:hypothetical protein
MSSSDAPEWLREDIKTKDINSPNNIRRHDDDNDSQPYENIELGHTSKVVTISTDGEPKHKKIVQMTFKIVNMGACVMEAACGALGIAHTKSVKETALVFVGLYMILFAAIIFLYEMIQIRPCGYIDEVWKKNFGFLYGVGGKCCFIIFMGILAFGISEPIYDMAMSTGVLVAFWGFIQGVLYWKFPEYFDQKEKYVPH